MTSSTTPEGTNITNHELGESLARMRIDQFIEVFTGITHGINEEHVVILGLMNELIGRFQWIAKMHGENLKKEIADCPPIRFSIVRNDTKLSNPDLPPQTSPGGELVLAPGPVIHDSLSEDHWSNFPTGSREWEENTRI